jgi:hypothetical protein
MKHRFLYGLFLLLLSTVSLQAQDEDYDADADSAVAVAEDQPAAYQEKTYEPEPASFRTVPDSATNRLKKRKEFAYANDPAYWINEPVKPPQKGFWDHFYEFFGQDGVRMLMYGLLIAFFLFIIYRVMVVNNLYLFYRNKKAKPVLSDDEAGIEDDNLDEKIIKAVSDKQHRMAVRYMYLKALRLLNGRQWIRFHTQATNYEYVNQMSGHAKAGEFRFLTTIYDYVWYGEFALNDEQFKIVHNNFQQFYNAVK